MKFIKIFYLFIFCHFTLQGQEWNHLPQNPYEPLEINGIEPIWYYTLYDSTVVGSDTTDGYNNFRYQEKVPEVINDGYIYTVDYHYQWLEGYLGTYVIKRNLNTGEEIWRVRYGYPSDSYEDIAQLMYINESGDLEIIGQYKDNPYGTEPARHLGYCDNMVFSRRIYNVTNGELVDFYHQDYTNANVKRIQSDPGSKLPFIEIDDDQSIRLFDLINDASARYGISYESAIFNKIDFGIQKVDTFDMIEPFCSSSPMKESSPFPIGEDKYLIVERYIDDGQLIFRYVDKELNVLEEFYSDNFPFIPYSTMFSAASPDNKLFLFCYRALSDTEPDRMWYLLLNERAETVNIIRKDLEETAPVLEVLKWDKEGVYFVQVKFHTDYNNLARIDSRLAEYYMEYNGGLTLVKEFPINIDRFISAMQSKFIDGKYYLFKIQEGGTKLNDVPPDGLRYRYDPAASAISYMLIDKETFGIPSSSQDVEISTVSLFPNPSPGTFHLEAEGMQGYDISLQDIMGRQVWKAIIGYDGRIEADLTYLPAGLYPYTITLEGRVVYRGKWLKK